MVKKGISQGPGEKENGISVKNYILDVVRYFRLAADLVKGLDASAK